MKTKKYEIVNKITDTKNYEYEEITFEDFLNKSNLSQQEKNETIREKMAINMHFMLAEETFDQAMITLHDILTDNRLAQLNAIVFLSLKRKGRGESFTPLSHDKFKQIVDFAIGNNIRIGFDSCSVFKYLSSVKEQPNFKQLEMYSEPCESSIFSSYFNVDGHFFPCSFSEGTGEWEKGIDATNCNDFLKDIWYHKKTNKFRNILVDSADKNNLGCRECPLFKV